MGTAQGDFVRTVVLWRSTAHITAIKLMNKMDWCVIHTDEMFEHINLVDLYRHETLYDFSPMKQLGISVIPNIVGFIFRHLCYP